MDAALTISEVLLVWVKFRVHLTRTYVYPGYYTLHTKSSTNVPSIGVHYYTIVCDTVYG